MKQIELYNGKRALKSRSLFPYNPVVTDAVNPGYP